MSNDGPLGQPRGIGFGILMYIITLSFYSVYWAFKTFEELKQHTGEGIGGVFGLVVRIVVISPVSLFLAPSEIGKMYRRTARRPRLPAGRVFGSSRSGSSSRRRFVWMREDPGLAEPVLGVEAVCRTRPGCGPGGLDPPQRGRPKSGRPPRAWNTSEVIPLEQRFPRPSVMGIVNVTPDSFSDGGVNLDPGGRGECDRATRWRTGAALVDVGGESTRPGAEAVPLDEELRRVVPVLEAIAGELPVSIDTSKAGVAARALELGAIFVNDVTALRGDPGLAGVVADSGAFLCLMHMLGEPRTMQDDPRYDDVVADVARFLEERLAFAVAEGIAEERICLDPGIGFGKTVEHNVELLARLGELAALGRPLVVGASRKRFLGRLLGDPEATTGPLAAGIAAAVTAYERGATILRVHDVRPHVEALAVAAEVEAST